MIKIETVYDLLEFSKEHPDYQYTCYDGEWLIYPDNSSGYLKDIEINYKMMRVLEDWDKVLDFKCYTISHRAVRNFKIDYEYAKKKIEEIKTFLETAIITVKDKKYSSLKQIEDALSISKYKVSHDKTTIRNSYWGGGYIISDEYYKKEKEALDKAYNDIISNKMTTTCDICGKEIIGVENFI